MVNCGAERPELLSILQRPSQKMGTRRPVPHTCSSVMLALVVLFSLCNSSDAFSGSTAGCGVSINSRLGSNSKIGCRGYRRHHQQDSFTASGRSRRSVIRQLNTVDNDEGKVGKVPDGGDGAINKSTEYLYNITGTEEDRAKERNKVKLREAVNEVKGAARVVKEKTSKLKNEVLKEEVKTSASNSTSAGEKESKKAEKVAEVLSEVTESTAKLGGTVIKKSPSILVRLFLLLVSREMRRDLNRRKVHYISDWTDGFKHKRQTVPAILFLYFACLSPAVSFGTISDQLTNGSIGVVEFLLSCGVSGMVSRLIICCGFNRWVF